MICTHIYKHKQFLKSTSVQSYSFALPKAVHNGNSLSNIVHCISIVNKFLVSAILNYQMLVGSDMIVLATNDILWI